MSTAWIVLMSIWLAFVLAALVVSVQAFRLQRAERYSEAASAWFLASNLFFAALPFSLVAIAVA